MPSTSCPESALQATGVVKKYGQVPILSGINLDVRVGTSFGLVGVNGAGKTTLIKCLLDSCALDEGTVSIFGVSNAKTTARSRIAFVPERFIPPHYLKCREFLELTSSLAGEQLRQERVDLVFDELMLDRVSLERPVRQLSKGMTQKLGLASCLMVERDMYLLDEPMSGLDPASRVAVKSVFRRLAAEGRTLFFTSHVLSDVEELCTAIAVLDRGEIRFDGAPQALCEAYSEPNLERAFMRCINVSQPSLADS